jgi:hypothetical protein
MTATLAPDLQPIDRVLTRWGKHERRPSMPIHPLEKIRMLHDGAVFSGPVPEPDWILLIDSAVTKAPNEVRVLIVRWYCFADPVTVKAQRLGLSRASLYTHWHGALRYMQGSLGEKINDIA